MNTGHTTNSKLANWLRNYWLLGVGIVTGLALGLFVIPNLHPYTFHGTVLQSPNPAPSFTLTTHMGRTVSLDDFRGELVVLFFGYTYCPDVCPATLGVLSRAMELLGKKAAEVQVLFVTVDPERDTPEQLAEHLTYYNPDFLGLTGTLEEITQVAALYGIYFEKQEGDSAADYLMDHTASVMVIDRESRLKLVLPFGVSADDMATDLERIMR